MTVIKKYFGTDKKKEETSLAIVKTQTAVVLKGQKIFDIYEDGNGNFRAQHKSGDWLYDSDNLMTAYSNAKKFSSIDSCQECAERYIKSHQLRKVGTIEFIPTPKGQYDD